MKLPHRCGNYLLVERIAKGGMAEIYRAKYRGVRGFSKDYAVKRILPVWSENREIERMLIDEARALVHLQHQNIVQVFELGKDRESFFISMEYVDGYDLRKIYDALERTKSRMPEKFSCYIIMEVLKALDFAHNKRDEDGKDLQIVHRDISPQNIMISRHGEVRLTDFGIAKGLHRNQETTAHQLKGKYAYMSPEQASGSLIDRRSDLFSLAVVFYEILTGMRLFRSDNDFDTIRNVREVRLPIDWNVYIGLDVRRIIEKALSLDRANRYQDAGEFLSDLNQHVLSSRNHTDGPALARYMRSIEISDESEDSFRTRPLDGASLRSLSMGLICRMTVSLLVIPFVLLNTRPPAETASQLEVREVVDEDIIPQEVVEVQEPEPRPPPASNGRLIKIESHPPGAEGSFRYVDEVRTFVTPTIITNVEYIKGAKVQVVLEKKGYQILEDQFDLGGEGDDLRKNYRLISTKPATLTLQARPWGIVSVPGLIRGRETPIHRLQIKAGSHRIQVRYPPSDRTVSANLEVSPGSRFRCLADFQGKPNIRCHRE